MTIQQHASFDSTVAKLNATSKLVKAFEATNAKRAAKGLGMTLMAVSLAACGSDSDPVAIIEEIGAGDVTDVTDAAEVAPVVVDTLTTIEAQASTLLATIALSDIAVNAATIAAAADSEVMNFNNVTLATAIAPATVAAATTNFDATAAGLQNEIDPATATLGRDAPLRGLDASNGIGTYATTTFATLANMLLNDTAVTAAQITTLATADASLTAAFAFEAASDNSTVLAAQVAANGAALTTALQTTAAAAFAAIGTHTGTNNANTVLSGDNVAATAAEILAGEAALGAVIHNAILANNAVATTGYAAAFAALSAANQQIIIDAVTADMGTVLSLAAHNADANTGAITGFVLATDPEVLYTSAIAAVNGSGVVLAGPAQPSFAGTIMTITVGEIDTIVSAAEDQAIDAAMMAAYNSLLASIDAIAAADASSQIAAIEAGNVATLSLGADNIDINGLGASTGNDVFIFNEANGNLVIGSAATAAAPQNVLFGTGDDSVIILGEYTFVTITTAAQFAAIATTDLGEAGTTEIFVYQNATNGNTVLTVEDNAFDGSTTTGTAMTTLTLTDITWSGVDVTVIDGNTILSEVAAVIA